MQTYTNLSEPQLLILWILYADTDLLEGLLCFEISIYGESVLFFIVKCDLKVKTDQEAVLLYHVPHERPK